MYLINSKYVVRGVEAYFFCLFSDNSVDFVHYKIITNNYTIISTILHK